jgi:hypothetical protein
MGRVASRWAFRKADDSTFLSFHFPPPEDTDELKLNKKGGGLWEYMDDMDGIKISNLVPELIKKELIFHCQNKGLLFCTNSFLPYFPQGLLKSDRYYFNFFDGSKPFIKVYGERKYYKPGGSERYRYHYAPDFYIFRQSNGSFAVLLRIYIRLTDLSGKCLEVRKIVSRRKRLCQYWFNDEWSKRIIGIMRFLGPDGKIEIGGTKKDRLVISSHPCCWEIPFSINEDALTADSVPANVCVEYISEEDGEEDI